MDVAIGTAVNKAQEHAVESLGMKDILVCGNCWENPPIPAHREEDFQDDECDDDHLEPGGQIDAFLHNELQCTNSTMKKLFPMTSKQVYLNLHDETFKRLPTSLQMFQKIEKESEKKDTQAKLKHNIMVEVNLLIRPFPSSRAIKRERVGYARLQIMMLRRSRGGLARETSSRPQRICKTAEKSVDREIHSTSEKSTVSQRNPQ